MIDGRPITRTSVALSSPVASPTPRTASISPDVNDPAARNVTFAELRAAYREQAEGLLERRDCEDCDFPSEVVDFERVMPFKEHLLNRAWQKFRGGARAEARGRDRVGDLEQDHRVERLADLVEHRVECLGLRHRAREAVEHEAVLVGEALADEVDHELVRDEVAALEDRAHLSPELRSVRDGGAQDVAGGDVRDAVRLGDPLRLCSFPRPLRA